MKGKKIKRNIYEKKEEEIEEEKIRNRGRNKRRKRRTRKNKLMVPEQSYESLNHTLANLTTTTILKNMLSLLTKMPFNFYFSRNSK